MKSPWKSVAPVDARTEYLVLASSIPPKSIRSTGASSVARRRCAASSPARTA